MDIIISIKSLRVSITFQLGSKARDSHHLDRTYAAVVDKCPHVARYKSLIWVHYVLDLIVGFYSFYIVFSTDWTSLLALCQRSAPSIGLDPGPCRASMGTLRGLYVGCFFAWKFVSFCEYQYFLSVLLCL